MERMKLKPGESKQHVYILCRVFNVGSKGVGMRLYLDPESARQNGELNFTVSEWAVTPLQKT